jgi:hypothetical protein
LCTLITVNGCLQSVVGEDLAHAIDAVTPHRLQPVEERVGSTERVDVAANDLLTAGGVRQAPT